MNGRQMIAMVLIVFGALLLVGNIFDFDTGRFFWPVLLVLVGLVLIFRPQSIFAPGVKYSGIGDTQRYGNWNVQEENDIRLFVGDVDLDFEDVDLPDGVTTQRVNAFVADVSLRVPAHVGVRLASNAFVTDAKVNGDGKEYVMSNMRYESDNYDSAAKKLDIEVNCFVNEVNLRHR